MPADIRNMSSGAPAGTYFDGRVCPFPRGATLSSPRVSERSVSADDRLAFRRTRVCRIATLRDSGRAEKSGSLVGMPTGGFCVLFPVCERSVQETQSRTILRYARPLRVSDLAVSSVLPPLISDVFLNLKWSSTAERY